MKCIKKMNDFVLGILMILLSAFLVFGKITETIEELPSEGGPNNVIVSIDLLKDNWRNYKIWLPVPQLEIDLNPNLEQNAVYAD